MRFAYGVSALAVLLAPFGCASLLGDFTSGGSPPGEDGGRADTGPLTDAGPGSDSTVPDAAGDGASPGDAVSPIDVQEEPDAAPIQLLLCNSWQNKTPTVLLQIPPDDAGQNNNNPISQISVEHLPGTSSARIVVSSSTTTGTDTTVFTVPENSSGGSTQSLAFPSTALRAELKTPNATAILLQDFSNGDYLIYAIPDVDPGNDAAAETPVATVTAPPATSNSGQFNAGFIPLTGGAYFTLASYLTTTAGQWDLTSWNTGTGSNWQVLLQGAEVGLSSSLATNGNDVFGFFPPPGSGNNGPAAISQYTFSTVDGGAPTTRAITKTGETGAAGAVAQTAAGYELMFIELSGTQSVEVLAGLVPAANIDTFVIDDLPSLSFKPGGDAGLFDTTTFGNNGLGARWLSNGDFGTMGSGGTGGTGGGSNGLNFYVGNTSGQWIIETAGTGQNLLAGQTVISAGFDLAGAFNDAVFSFDVAWTEQLLDGSAVLYFNELQCVAP
jgi:hypothetical protein